MGWVCGNGAGGGRKDGTMVISQATSHFYSEWMQQEKQLMSRVISASILCNYTHVYDASTESF